MPKLHRFPSFSGLFVTFAAALLAGCSSSFAPSPDEVSETPIGNIQGTVHGGQAPVSGAQIYLFAAGTTGYGQAATSLIASGKPGVSCTNNNAGVPAGSCYVTTDSNGNFALGGDYTCIAGTQVYMVAVGGNPGIATPPAVNNTAIVQMAGLGQCPAAGNLAAQVPYLVINEVTTVAFAYAMGGFATTPYNVSSNVASNSTAAATAIANAMANANNIVNLFYGLAPAVANGNTNSVNPQAKIHALANILSTCVNTSSPSSTGCTNLFNAATDSTGAVATDEASAIFNIVHNPANTTTNTTHVSNIWALNPSTPVFSSTLTTRPTDWTMPVVYSNVVSTPVSIAFDANGNAWIGDQSKGVVEIGPQGAVSTFHTNQSNGNQAFGTIDGAAIAPNGTIWVADFGSQYVYIMNSAGVVTTTISSGLQGPAGVAFDQNGNAFVVNETGETISTFNSSGTFTNSYSVSSNISNPSWIAVDTSENVWVTSTSHDFGELQYSSGSYSNFATYKLKPNLGLALDGNGNLWVATTTPNELVEMSSTGTTLATVKKSGLSTPQTVAVDGAGNIWIGNGGAAVISGFSNSAVQLYSAGLTTGSTGDTLAVTPDSSGNLWSANSDGTVSQILGAATPVATPILPGRFGVRP